MNHKSEDIVTKEILQEELNRFKSEIMDKLDHIVSELESAREDRTIATYQFTNLTETVENHENRITKLETPSSAV